MGIANMSFSSEIVALQSSIVWVCCENAFKSCMSFHYAPKHPYCNADLHLYCVCAINGWRYKELKSISIKCTSMRLPSHLDWNIWSNKMQLKRWTLDAVKGIEMEIEWRLCRKCWFHVTMGMERKYALLLQRDKVKDKLCVLLFRSK